MGCSNQALVLNPVREPHVVMAITDRPRSARSQTEHLGWLFCRRLHGAVWTLVCCDGVCLTEAEMELGAVVVHVMGSWGRWWFMSWSGVGAGDAYPYLLSSLRSAPQGCLREGALDLHV